MTGTKHARGRKASLPFSSAYLIVGRAPTILYIAYMRPPTSFERVQTATYCRICNLSITLGHIEINADKNALSPVHKYLDGGLSGMLGKMQHTSERHQGGR